MVETVQGSVEEVVETVQGMFDPKVNVRSENPKRNVRNCKPKTDCESSHNIKQHINNNRNLSENPKGHIATQGEFKDTVSEEMKEKYMSLYERLYNYSAYRKVFFETETSLRELIGIAHYCADDMKLTDEFPVHTINFFNKATVAGVNFESGLVNSSKDSITKFNFSEYTENQITDKIIELENKIKEDKPYYEAWIAIFDAMKKYLFVYYDTDSKDEITAESIRCDMNKLTETFKSLGLELKYYEDYEESSSEKTRFVVKNKYGFPSLLHNGKTVFGGIGAKPLE